MRTVVVTGGAGYIGSHVCKALSKANFLPVVFDNFENGHEWAVKWGPSFQGDIRNPQDLEECFKTYSPVGVIHLASYINVRESTLNPGKYYENNVSGTLTLLEAMLKHGIYSLVFSSSAAVYGNLFQALIQESSPTSPVNPYGRTKLMGEKIIEDFCQLGMRAICLRYFNAAGADLEGEIGEAHDPETHLIPSIFLTLLGKRKPLSIYGIDHPTLDGTAIRDYIHVSDLAKAHVNSLERVLSTPESLTLNLGTGKGLSVYEIIKAAEFLTKSRLSTQVEARNPAEPSILVADPTQALKLLSWSPLYSNLDTILTTAWHWHSQCEQLLSHS